MRVRKFFIECQTLEQIAVILSVGTLVLGIIFATSACCLQDGQWVQA